MVLFDTIAAIATPAGSGGLGVIRISGDDALAVADRLFKALSGRPLSVHRGYTASYGSVYNGDKLLDEAVALVFRAPKSYTGEDVVEIMCHGGEQVCSSVLRAVLDCGAVMAERGEFTRRALVNGRITLTEAEAVCDIINAASANGQSAAANLAAGALRKAADNLADRLMDIQAHLSAVIDFPEEDVEEIDEAALTNKLHGLHGELQRLVESYEVGSAVLRGVTAAIVGSPNVGKSTLLNLFAGAEKAIVTPVPGTTRDVVEQRVMIGGTALILADTAGIRDGADEVERIGVKKARERLLTSDIAIAVFDGSRALDYDDREIIGLCTGKKTLAVINKNDLKLNIERGELERAFKEMCVISANDRHSLKTLDNALSKLIGTSKLDDSAPVLANERQRSCAARAMAPLAEAERAVSGGALDAAYALCQEALEALWELSGKNVTEDVIERVFSTFCVGK